MLHRAAEHACSVQYRVTMCITVSYLHDDALLLLWLTLTLLCCPALLTFLPAASLCGACASSRCTSRQGCCLNAQRSACSCSSSRGLEPARRGNSSAPIFFCKWALRRPTRLWMVPVGNIVQIPFTLAGPWDADTATAEAVCPSQGFNVFIGSRGRNPLGTGLVYSRRTACPALSFNQLVPQEGVGEAELGEYCTNGQSWLMLNVTMPPGAGFEECWSVVMRLTDGTAYNAVFQFYEW